MTMRRLIFTLALAMLGAGLATAILPSASAESDTTVTFVPVGDAVHVSARFPSTNFASSGTLLSTSDAAGDSVVLLRFPLDHTTIDPKTYQVLSVKLHLHASTVTTAGSHEARLLASDAWNAGSVTWANAPSSNAASPAVLRTISSTGDQTWDLTPTWASDAVKSLFVDWPGHDGVLSVAVDPAGGSAEFSRTLTPYLEIVHRIDTSVPTPELVIVSHTSEEIADAMARGWWRTPLTVEARCADARSGCLSTKARVDGAGWSTGAGVASVVVAGDLGGAGHKVDLCSTDKVINEGCPMGASYKFDGTAPRTTATVVSGTSGFAAGWYRSDVLVNLTCADQTGLSGCASTSWDEGGSALTPYTGTIHLTDEGAHTVHTTSSDKAGNVETETTTTYRIDRIAPATDATLVGLAGDDGWWRTFPQLVLTCTDDASGCHASRSQIDTGAWATYDGAAPPVIPEGVHDVRFESDDQAGNVEPPVALVVKVDTTPPATTATTDGDAGGAWVGPSAILHLACEDATSGCARSEWSIDGGATWTLYDNATPPTLPDGIWTLSHRAFDVAGNVATVTRILRVDTLPPTTIGSPQGTLGQSDWWTSDVQLTILADDDTSAAPLSDVSGVETIFDRVRQRDAPAEGNFTPHAPPRALGEGRWDVDHRAADVAGNLGEIMTQAFNVDVTPPSTTLALDGLLGNDGWWLSHVTLALACEDATSGCVESRYRSDLGDPVTYDAEAPPILAAEGDTVLGYTSIDDAGLVGEMQTTLVRIDTVAPVSRLSWQGPHARLDPASGIRYVSSLQSLSLTATDATSSVRRIEWRLNDSADWVVYDGAFAIPSTLPDGPLVLLHRAVDVAGNVEDEISIAFVLDNTAPLVRFDRPFAPSAELNGTSVSLFLLRSVAPGAVRESWMGIPIANRAVVSGQVNVTANASDALSDVAGVQLFVDGIELDPAGAAHPWAWVWDARGSGLRNATLELVATDHLGNANFALMSVLVLPDDTAGLDETVAGTRLGVLAPTGADVPLPAPVLNGHCAGARLDEGVAVRGDRVEAGRIPVEAGLLVYFCPDPGEEAPSAQVEDLSERNTAEDLYDLLRPEIEALSEEDLDDDAFPPSPPDLPPNPLPA